MRRRPSVRGVARPAAVLVALLGVSAPLAPSTTRASTGITITAGGCAGGGDVYCYTPASAAGMTGAAAVWTNHMTGVGHTATLCTADACLGVPASTGGDKFDVAIGSGDGSSATFTFHSPGTYYYYCTVHGYSAMHGSIQISASQTASPPPTSRPPAPTPRPAARPTPTAAAAATTAPPVAGAASGSPAPPSPALPSSPSPLPAPLGTAGPAGGFPLMALIIVLAVALAGGAGAVLWRRSR